MLAAFYDHASEALDELVDRGHRSGDARSSARLLR